MRKQTNLERVSLLLKQFPEVENNEVYFLFAYWQVFDGLPLDESLFAQLSTLTKPDTVLRTKREYHRYQQYLTYLSNKEEDGEMEQE